MPPFEASARTQPKACRPPPCFQQSVSVPETFWLAVVIAALSRPAPAQSLVCRKCRANGSPAKTLMPRNEINEVFVQSSSHISVPVQILGKLPASSVIFSQPCIRLFRNSRRSPGPKSRESSLKCNKISLPCQESVECYGLYKTSVSKCRKETHA
ncbi:hypothetical protein TNIN_261721 [Trichonephila inaurata madagascariensis]|uniref:Uncharacterized protein n=1 Tax=Trichonephila inaurata madagascariensis TaxID=2747483 RepID=A0A8X7C5R6_9ARAC|nr:hypothetical protein TNIN_261721 [Trichonephila inaurata madagascariensis]